MEAPLPPNIEQMKTMHGTGNRRRAMRMPQRPSQRHRRATRHDEQDDVHAATLSACRHDDAMLLSACRYDDGMQNAATHIVAISTTRRHGDARRNEQTAG